MSPPLVLAPGWATDFRLFDGLKSFAPLVLPNAVPSTFDEDIWAIIHRAGVGKIDLLGFSMGGFLAARFAARYPDSVRRLFLVGVRKRYPDVPLIRRYLHKNPSLYLNKFYQACFPSPPATPITSLLEDYAANFSVKQLSEGLDYLEVATIPLGQSRPYDVVFIHGEADMIAPIVEARESAAGIKAPFNEVKGAGHMVFVDPAFGGLLEAYRSR